MMKRILFGGLALLVAFALPALGAGKNSGGAILVHTDDAHGYTFQDMCGQFDLWYPEITWDQLGTRTDKDPAAGALIWFVAAFHESASPGLTVIYFGNDHNLPQYYQDQWGFCGPSGSLETVDLGWPEDPANAGCSLAFGSPVVGDHLLPFYYFNAYGLEGAYYASAINPIGGYAGFVDDTPSTPFEDKIDIFGRVEWYTDGGENLPPQPPTKGACCFEDGSCTYVQELECGTSGGRYGGDEIECDPNPCGACCYWNNQAGVWSRKCIVTTEPDCGYTGTAGSDQGLNYWKYDNIGGRLVGSEWSYPGTMCAAEEGEAPGLWWCFDLRYDDPEAACCRLDETCELIQWTECWDLGQTGDGHFWGYGTDCDPNPCGEQPEGACCHADGTCEVLLELACNGANDEWQGADTTCDPNPCTGVCCVPVPPYECSVTLADECEEPNIWVLGLECEPENPCHQIPTESMSWGKLKTLYR